MRLAILALVSVCALAACNPSAPAGGEGASRADAGGGGLFPNLTGASYRAEATITGDNGQTIPVVMIRDGQKLRMEISAEQGRSTIITNGETGESFVISTAAGQTVAMRMDISSDNRDPTADWQGDMASATRTGSCSVAGETGAEWTREENGTPHTACITQDGIILQAREGDRTMWETTGVQRGPQSADLFTLPPGVQVMDLGNVGAAMEDAMARAKAAAGQ